MPSSTSANSPITLAESAFQRFFTVLGAELPTIVRNLSTALGRFMNGVAGTFAAILPYVERLAKKNWRKDAILASGLNVDGGELVHPALKGMKL